MNTYTSSPTASSSALQNLQRRVTPLLAALLATLVSLPAHAITLPTTPLQTGGVFPAPDIFLILDDSGSMHDTKMPDDPGDTTPHNIGDQAYTLNSLSYNPNITYQPWIKADGSRWTPSLLYNDVSDDTDNITGSTDLTDDIQTFYVPKTTDTTTAYITAEANYYRYEILPYGKVVQAVWATTGATGAGIAITPIALTTLSSTTPRNTWWNGTTSGSSSSTAPATAFTFAVPAGVSNLSVTIAGADSDADLYVRRGNWPTTGNGRCPGSDTNSSEVCSINNPTAGTYFIGVRAANNNSSDSFAGVTLTAVYTIDEDCPNPGSGQLGWRDCTLQTPTGRTDSAEMTNYATWYSYYRTRLKMAKGGASEAFSQIGSNLRVGFNTIHDKVNNLGVHIDKLDIPVGSDGGLFRDQGTSHNKTNWYTKLQGESAGGSTPLRSALQRTGNYYEDNSGAGPWGPETDNAQVSCRQAFAILTTDGYWNTGDDDDFTSVGDADSTTDTVDDATISYKNPLVNDTAVPPVGHRTYAPDKPYKDNSSPTRSNTLADVAMYYWKNDLISSLPNNVPTTSGVDTAFWQHMVTFGIALGANGTLTPVNAATLAQITSGSKHWPLPTNSTNGGDGTNIDDLWHAAVNSRGSFVIAQSPTQFVTALTNALASINARKGSASNVSTNSTSFQTNTRVFQAIYRSGDWTGELSAYVATSAGVQPHPAWNASQLIPAYGSRNIKTWVGGACAPCGTPFPTTAQKTALDVAGRALSGVSGDDNAAYLAGDTSKEKRNAGILRSRTIAVDQGGPTPVILPTVLGDIVDSTPVYVPELQTIFVGGNDGMLHAFDASNDSAQYGKERFAYVPGGIVLADLKTLSDPQYGQAAAPHAYFVDGPIAVSSTTQTPGHNYLVGALGRGGKGVYGLDVHNPSSFANTDVKWESNSATNMGYVLGEPVIVKLNDASGTEAVLVSNGINSSFNHATLFVLNLATGALIHEFDTPGAGANIGLSAPRAWDNDGNGTVDYVYAGDLHGNLWKFDLRNAVASSWTISGGSFGVPLFVATDSANKRQPITAGLALAREPVTGHRWIFIGTGQFLTTADVANVDVQSMYGIIDDDTTAVTGRTSGGDGELQVRTFTVSGKEAGKKVRAFEPHDDLDTSKRGWYIDLLNPPPIVPPDTTYVGERIVSNPRIFGIALITASLIPPQNFSCDAGGGGFINALDAFSGSSLAEPFFNVNANSSGGHQDFSDDTLNNGTVDIPVGSVDLGLGMPTLPTMIDNLLIAGGSSGTIGNIAVNPQGPGARRVSWREIEKD